MHQRPADLEGYVDAAIRRAASRQSLIVSDHPMVADGVGRLVHGFDAEIAVTVISDRSEAMEALAWPVAWSVIFLDFGSRAANGLEMARDLAERLMAPCSCLVAAPRSAATLVQARALGLAGYLSRDMPLASMAVGIEAVLRGERYYPDLGETPADAAPRLSRRQIQLLGLLSRGLTSRQIARRLGTATGTVNNQMVALQRALCAASRAQAVARGLQLGYVPDPLEDDRIHAPMYRT
jgi:DNA-binding NarL/FixJ family response regulator